MNIHSLPQCGWLWLRVERDEERFDGLVWVQLRRCRGCGVGSEFGCINGATELKRMREPRFHWTRSVL